MTKLKIIEIFIDDISMSGGTERIAEFMSRTFIRNDFKVRIVTLAHQRPKPFFELDPKIEVLNLDASSFKAIFQHFKTSRADLRYVVSMGRLGFLCSFAKILAFSHCPLIVCEHVAFRSTPWYISCLKLVGYNIADRVIVLTDYDKKILARFVRSRIDVIRNPSRFETANEKTLLSKENVAIAIGRLTYQKGFDRLLRLWSRMNMPDDWRLEIYGDGEDRDELKKTIEDLKLSEQVFLMGSTKFIENVYKKAKIILMTSRYEGLPLVLIEAKSHGVASVSFDCKTGPDEIIVDKVDGFIVPENMDSVFIACTENLACDDELLLQTQKNALRGSIRYAEEAIESDWITLSNEIFGDK